ncbi:hypothetical protein RJT34_02809 [Clitoria ternatea]|uniref:Uncharacterized protein n=1 Tax=Clitoria ternatea TaxID=43366 RepID=A0AAN9Q0L9_CLITE
MDDPSCTYVKDFVEVVEDSMDGTNDEESIKIVQDSMEDDDEDNAGIMDSLDSIQGYGTNLSLRVTQDNNSYVLLNIGKRKKATGAKYEIDLNKIPEEVKWEWGLDLNKFPEGEEKKIGLWI